MDVTTLVYVTIAVALIFDVINGFHDAANSIVAFLRKGPGPSDQILCVCSEHFQIGDEFFGCLDCHDFLRSAPAPAGFIRMREQALGRVDLSQR